MRMRAANLALLWVSVILESCERVEESPTHMRISLTAPISAVFRSFHSIRLHFENTFFFRIRNWKF